MASEFSLNSAIKYLTAAVFTVGLKADRSIWWNLCIYFMSLYHYNVSFGHCICIFTNTFDLYAFVVFCMYSIQYVYILLSCIFAEVDEMMVFFLPLDWYGQKI